MQDPFDLNRFVEAQAPVCEAVRSELAAGRKSTHWMWFVFPQIAGLGMSAMSQRYAIQSLSEARAYLAHPLLGARLRQGVALVAATEGRSAYEIFGAPDDMKLRSCLTLFERAAAGDEALAANPAAFTAVLDRFYSGERCGRTLALLEPAD